MNSAQALAHRLYLGLTVNQLADTLDVHERSVRRWESPDRPGPPPGVAAELDQLITRYDALIATIDQLQDPLTIPQPDTTPHWAEPDLPWQLIASALATAALTANRPLTWEQPTPQ